MLTWGERFLIVAVLIGAPLILIGVPVYLFLGGLRTFALRPLQRCYAGLDLHSNPMPGDVAFVYHTYRGFLVWITQDEHRILAPPHDARILLRRLLRFNLTWGMLSYGMLFVPFLALGNYYAQRKSIDEQVSQHQS